MPPLAIAAASALVLFLGSVLLLSELRWFSRKSLDERLRLYVPGGMGTRPRAGMLSVESFREILAPLVRGIGERMARVFGVAEELQQRLERVHSPMDVTGFRVRQAAWMLAGFGVGALLTFAPGVPVLFGLLVLLGAPLMSFLVIEQRLAHASARWQRRVFLELPVIAEQLGMLLSSGYSLTGGLNRIAERGRGACSADLRRVTRRVRQGLSEIDALREWASLADVEALNRMIPVLALNREASDLGRLISAEAQAIRRDVQREIVEIADRRGQQVWIPVTVATLLPGVIFMAIPFIEALRLFAS